MTFGNRIGMTLGIAASALVVAVAADAARITVVRDVAARDSAPVAVKDIHVVRDVSARPPIARRPALKIKVVRDTPARDAARAAKAIGYFSANERLGR